MVFGCDVPSRFQVKELVASDDFKPNSAMVVLDFLIRHSLLEPDTGVVVSDVPSCSWCLRQLTSSRFSSRSRAALS